MKKAREKPTLQTTAVVLPLFARKNRKPDGGFSMEITVVDLAGLHSNTTVADGFIKGGTKP